MYSYVYSEFYLALLEPNENPRSDEAGRITRSELPKLASISYMRWSITFGVASTFIFFLGFVVAFIGLIRY
jgi:hypothetical protein